MTSSRPWDARIAAWMVRPLRNSAVTPNQLTTVRLGTGMIGIWLLAGGDNLVAGAWLICLSNFLDHTDGELARMTGKDTRFGHVYDLASDALITVGMFVGLGLGLSRSANDYTLAVLGTISGIAVAAIFHMRNDMEERLGKAATRQRNFAGFEAEDVLYLFPLVTVFGIAREFIAVAAVGAPIAALIVLALYVRSSRGNQ